MVRLPTCLIVALGLLLWSAAGHASNGYLPIGWGALIKGMAGAGIALPGKAPLSGANNPAAILGVADHALQLDLFLLYAEVEFDVDPLPPNYRQHLDPGEFPLPPGEGKGNPAPPLNTFFIPQGGFNWRLGERAAFALLFYANGGLNTTYEDEQNPVCPPHTAGSGLYCGGGVKLDIAQFFIAPTLALEVTDWWHLGISPILAVETVEIRGLSAFAPLSADPDSLTNNGHDWAMGYGFKFGTRLIATDTLSFGAVFQTEIDIGSFKDYEGILPDHGQLDIPAYVTLGVAWRFLPRWTVAFDVQRVFYSEVAATGNEPDNPRPLGAEDGPGFGWEDSTIYKLGVRWTPPGDWTWRFGFARVEPLPVEEDQLFFNLLATSVLQNHFTVGASYQFSDDTFFDFALIYASKNKIDGANPKFPRQHIAGSLEMIGLDLSWRHRF